MTFFNEEVRESPNSRASYFSCRQVLIAFIISCLALPVIAITAPDPVLINMGGPRKVEAKISTVDDEYRVDLKMLAVRSFDEATNSQVNREKARLLALQALIRHLSNKSEAEASCSGVRILATRTDKQFFTLSLSLPKNGFLLVKPAAAVDNHQDDKPVAKGERLTWKSELFTKKDDFQRTIDLLKVQFVADIVAAEKTGKDFEDRIAEIEDRAVTSFKSLRAEVASESLLLTIEMEELGAKAKDAEKMVMAKLKEAVQRNEIKETKTKEPFR